MVVTYNAGDWVWVVKPHDKFKPTERYLLLAVNHQDNTVWILHPNGSHYNLPMDYVSHTLKRSIARNLPSWF